MNNKNLKALLGLALVVAAVVMGFIVKSLYQRPTDNNPNGPPSGETSRDLVMGNPSGATTEASNADNYLMRKPYFALAYNNAKGTPNWVSWCLQEGDLGSAPREEFHPDPDLPAGLRRIVPNDYRGSGFDRGHMCPHSDRASTTEASTATFVMTNMIPQAPNCNQEAWADFEDYCRQLVKKHHQTLYIVSGPAGKGGIGSKGEADALPEGKGYITVPAKCWKVVLAVDGGTGSADDVGRVKADSRLIAVIMPNEQGIGHGWQRHRTSVKEVEALTGYHFFDRVPEAIIGPLKAKVDQKEH